MSKQVGKYRSGGLTTIRVQLRFWQGGGRENGGTGLVAGVVLAFAKAMGEFGATITFVANIPGQTQTLPSAIYAFL